jgi:hypothetical protein
MSVPVWELPPPAIIGNVSLAEVQALSDKLPDIVYTGCQPTTPDDLLKSFDEWGEAQEPMHALARSAIIAASQAVPLKAMGFTLLKETLGPWQGGSNPSAWHANDSPAVLLSSDPTTEFAVGALEVPSGSKLLDLQNSAASLIPEVPEPERDGVGAFMPKPGEFTLLTQTDVHRAPTNKTDAPVDRLFIKFDVVQRRKLIVARPRHIRRVT